ncbi:MAG: signal peptidase I [Wujia sp.]
MRRINVKKVFRGFWQWVLLVFIAVIVGYAFVTFCFQTVTVVGPSMNPTLKDGQIVVIEKMSTNLSKINRFDIICFAQRDAGSYYDIKRVVGLPEERIRLSNGDIYINGERLKETPFHATISMNGVAQEEITLGEDEYFVLGDNVNNSEDSRYTNVGNISKTEIKGKVIRILQPKSERGKVK